MAGLTQWRLECLAVLFDLDGVLVDSLACSTRHWERWAAEHGVMAEHLRDATPGRRIVDTIRILTPHLDVEALATKMEEAQGRDTTGVEICVGAKALFEQLSNAQRAIVTSATRGIALARLRACGLEAPNVLVTSEDVAAGKPDPEGYLRAAHALGVPAADCVVIEDAEAGVVAARTAGMRVISVMADRAQATFKVPANASVSSLAEVRTSTSWEAGKLRISLSARGAA